MRKDPIKYVHDVVNAKSRPETPKQITSKPKREKKVGKSTGVDS